MSVTWGLTSAARSAPWSTGREAGRRIEILSRERRCPRPPTEEAMTRMCEMALHQAAGERILGVGLSAGNPMDAAKGGLLNPPTLPGWSGVSLTDWAAKALGAPARLENDANACALAEWRWGAGRGAGSMVFLTFGTGFGAGLILDGKRTGRERQRGRGGPQACHGLAAPSGYGKLGSIESFCSGGGIRQLALTVVRAIHATRKALRVLITARRSPPAPCAGAPRGRRGRAGGVPSVGRYAGPGAGADHRPREPRRRVIGSTTPGARTLSSNHARRFQREALREFGRGLPHPAAARANLSGLCRAGHRRARAQSQGRHIPTEYPKGLLRNHLCCLDA